MTQPPSRRMQEKVHPTATTLLTPSSSAPCCCYCQQLHSSTNCSAIPSANRFLRAMVAASIALGRVISAEIAGLLTNVPSVRGDTTQTFVKGVLSLRSNCKLTQPKRALLSPWVLQPHHSTQMLLPSQLHPHQAISVRVT